MGTEWKISIWDSLTSETLEEIKKEIIARSEAFDTTYSRFIPNSFISSLADKTGIQEVPKDLLSMLRLYFELYELSERKLNPLIGSTLSDLGYDASYSLTPQEEVRRTPDLFETVSILDDSQIALKQKVLIDLGALGKGYFVDVIAGILKERSVKRFLVDGSGDIFYQGDEPIVVGLEDPNDATKVIGTLSMTTGALCGSGTNKRAWRDLHHVIDPHTSKPTVGAKAVWVQASTCVMADALASVAFFVPLESVQETYPCEYLIHNDQGKIKRSAGFSADLFMKEN